MPDHHCLGFTQLSHSSTLAHILFDSNQAQFGRSPVSDIGNSLNFLVTKVAKFITKICIHSFKSQYAIG